MFPEIAAPGVPVCSMFPLITAESSTLASTRLMICVSVPPWSSVMVIVNASEPNQFGSLGVKFQRPVAASTLAEPLAAAVVILK